MTFSGPSEAMRAIRELHETYSDAVVRQDVETYLSCWAEDGQRSGGGGECSGKAELQAHFLDTFRSVEQMGFFTQLAAIAVDGTTATARSYTLEFIKQRDGPNLQVIGEYTDELAVLDQGWVFSRRQFRVVMMP